MFLNIKANGKKNTVREDGSVRGLSSVPGTQVKMPEAALVSNSSAEDVETSGYPGLLASLR